MSTAKRPASTDALRAVAVAFCLLSVGCGVDNSETDLVWAVNIGGPAHTGSDGTRFAAEESVSGG